MLRPGGRLLVCLSVIERDRIDDVSRLDADSVRAIGRKLAAASGGVLMLRRAVALTPGATADLHSTWAKRIGVGRTRPGWMLEFRSLSAEDA